MATSVMQARRFVADTMCSWGCEDPTDAAILLTSEVVTNAVLHASTAIELEVCLTMGDLATGDVLVVETADDDAEPPVLRHVTTDRESGRGIFLVETLARRWGVRARRPGGKIVWFEVLVVASQPT